MNFLEKLRQKDQGERNGIIDTSRGSLAETDDHDDHDDDERDVAPMPQLQLRLSAIASETPSTATSSVRRRSSLKIPLSDGLRTSLADAATRASARRSYRPLELSEEDAAASQDDLEGHTPPKNHTWNSYNLIAPYYKVMRDYPMYRAYFFSHFCQNMGDWFVRIASLLVVEAINSQNESETEDSTDGSDGKMLSHLVLSVLLPRAIFSQVGGVLSDRYDRRRLMIGLDLAGGFVVLGYLLGLHYQSLPWIYVISMIRSALAATYYPITTGMVALLVPSPSDLQYAVTLNSWAWGSTSILGGLLAGSLAGRIGLSTCYWIDSITFFLSAWVVSYGIQGDFKVPTSLFPAETAVEDVLKIIQEPTSGMSETEIVAQDSVFNVILQNWVGVSRYLSTCGFGCMILLKASATFVWGIEDIVGAEFTTVFDSSTGEEDTEQSAWNMGILFAVIGCGNTLGPVLVNTISDAKHPVTLQRAGWIGLGFLTVGWMLIGQSRTFHQFLGFTFVRTIGSGIVWVYSTLILQTLTSPSLLGRVLAVEYTLATLTEALSSTAAGNLAQKLSWDPHQLAYFGSFLGLCCTIAWWTATIQLAGAANPRFNTPKNVVPASQPTGASPANRPRKESSNYEIAHSIEV